ncbi:hypothetical protein LA080_013663 [Diaporthe eres]|nr:hypothetical protein LA080_013663 [Diaporthe eres]
MELHITRYLGSRRAASPTLTQGEADASSSGWPSGLQSGFSGPAGQAGPALAEALAPIHTPSGLGSWAVPCRAQETTPDPILHKPVHPAKKALAIRAQDGELPPSRSSLAPSGISLSLPLQAPLQA